MTTGYSLQESQKQVMLAYLLVAATDCSAWVEPHNNFLFFMEHGLQWSQPVL